MSTRRRRQVGGALVAALLCVGTLCVVGAAAAYADGLDHLVLSPATSSIVAGGSASYTAEGFDQLGNDLGDVTADTTFTVTPDGDCTGSSCSATIAGEHTVTGLDGAASGTASLTVDAGPLTGLVLTPTPAELTPGQGSTVTAEGFDGFGNDLGDQTAVSVFSISAGGSCVTNICFSFTAGFYTVTAKKGSVSGTTTIHVGQKQKITFVKPRHVKLSASTVTVSATSTSGLPVTFTSSTPGVCTADGTNGETVTLLTAGTCTIVASQPGDTNFISAPPVTRNFKVK